MSLIRLFLLTLALFAGLSSIAPTPIIGVTAAHAAPAGYAGHVGRMGPSSLAIDPDAKAAIAAMTVQPSARQQQRLSRLVRDLKTLCQCWADLDLLMIFAQHDSQAARVDLRNPSRVATFVNSPTWVRYGYVQGDGATSYVDTGFNTSTGTAYQRDSAHFSIWSFTSGNSSSIDVGNLNTLMRARNGGFMDGRMNSTTTQSVSNPSGAGHLLISRGLSTSYSRYRNGASLGDQGSTSAAPSNATLFVGAQNTGSGGGSYSTRQIGAVSAGGYLTPAKAASFYTILNDYFTEVGAQ